MTSWYVITPFTLDIDKPNHPLRTTVLSCEAILSPKYNFVGYISLLPALEEAPN